MFLMRPKGLKVCELEWKKIVKNVLYADGAKQHGIDLMVPYHLFLSLSSSSPTS